MHRNWTIAVAGLLLLGAPGHEAVYAAANDRTPPANTLAGAVTKVSPEFTTSTKAFIDAATLGDMYEVGAGKLAAMRARSAEVKKFARQMVEAHTATSKRLKATLASLSPGYVDMLNMLLDSKHEGMLNDLRAARDKDFDGRYIAQQVKAHEDAVALMRDYAKNGDNSEIKKFAADTLPVIQMHLKMITGIERRHRARNS